VLFNLSVEIIWTRTTRVEQLNAYKILFESLIEIEHVEEQDVEGRGVLKFTYESKLGNGMK